MDVTIRKILSLMDSNELVSILAEDGGEYFGTVEDCQAQLPDFVLDSFVLNIHVYADDAGVILEVYGRRGK